MLDVTIRSSKHELEDNRESAFLCKPGRGLGEVRLQLFLLLCFFCIVATTVQIIWLHNHIEESWYLNWSPTMTSQWFAGFGYYFLLMYQMIPVSLYVTISMVMFIQAIFMTWDLDMYYEDHVTAFDPTLFASPYSARWSPIHREAVDIRHSYLSYMNTRPVATSDEFGECDI